MKNLLYLLCFFTSAISAQENCQGSFTEYYLNSNNIRASFFPRGNKFTDGSDGAFLAPYPSSGRLSTIFASSPWLAGFDDPGNLRMAAETYPTPATLDFAVGPLNSIGLPYYAECPNFDKAWSVFSEDVIAHKEDYEFDFKLDDTIPSIFGWPGRGNKYFSRFNGFELPDNGVVGFADFYDTNGNSLYDPDAGDYPALELSHQYFIPDQMMWMVFNDLDTLNHAGHTPIRVEFQLTAFAFHCQDKEWLNNAIFNKYRIIYRGLFPIDSSYFGFWTDYDLGCSIDDFMGSDSARRTEFVYNADMTDGDAGVDCSTGAITYASRPPVQSMTWLSHPMHSFVAQEHDSGFPPDKYNLLNGLWGDGTPIRPEGDGYHTNPTLTPTKFLFHGDPRDTSAWAAINVFEEGKEQRGVSSISLGRLDPGARINVFTAHMFHDDPDADHLGQITYMYNNVDSLLNMSWLSSEEICIPYPVCNGDDCVWPGDFDHNGIADHRDYLTWGVLNDQTGPGRNGLISWRGHYADDWNVDLFDINAKHADGDGNGLVNIADIDINTENIFLTNRFYSPDAQYPQGADIILKADPKFDSQGRIRNFEVRTGQALDNVLGIAFTVEFDTALFQRQSIIPDWPDDDPDFTYYLDNDINNYTNVVFVKTDHTGISLDSNSSIIRYTPFSFRLKPGKTIPDSTIIRLRNLKAIDPEGNDHQLGSEQIVIYRDGFVGIEDPLPTITTIYPNPTDGFIHIDTDLETEAQIYSMQGRLLSQFTRSEVAGPIDVTGFSPGIYILRIVETGESIKVVIQ